MTTTSYRVGGMTCEHCVHAVTEELRLLDGVRAVDVDLASGDVTVTSEEPLDEAAVRASVDKAGYAVVS